ncbi:MAG: hypothetical protein QG585_294 [Patescibacteria group bacterium]|jgi:hypothetical protein|nr:hypothetical protein [Patescibacteria group bacterium]
MQHHVLSPEEVARLNGILQAAFTATNPIHQLRVLEIFAPTRTALFDSAIFNYGLN